MVYVFTGGHFFGDGEEGIISLREMGSMAGTGLTDPPMQG